MYTKLHTLQFALHFDILRLSAIYGRFNNCRKCCYLIKLIILVQQATANASDLVHISVCSLYHYY